MIQLLTPALYPRFQTLVQQDDFIGMRIASALRCYGTDSSVCRFYLVDETAALMVLGTGALLCGVAQNVDELEQFLACCGVANFKANRTMLYHWTIVPQLVMKYTGSPAPCAPAQAAEVQAQPNLWQLSQSGLFGAISAEDWYADACLRINKGETDIRAIAQEGHYVATAGIYSIGPRSVYLTAVATAPESRKRGFCTALLAALCTAHAEKTTYLLCSPALRKFYEKRGFTLVIPLCEFTNPNQTKEAESTDD